MNIFKKICKMFSKVKEQEIVNLNFNSTDEYIRGARMANLVVEHHVLNNIDITKMFEKELLKYKNSNSPEIKGYYNIIKLFLGVSTKSKFKIDEPKQVEELPFTCGPTRNNLGKFD